MRIGVLEDEPAICGLLKEILEIQHHVVSVYHHGSDLLEVLAINRPIAPTNPFDMLLIDLLLPGDVSGIQVIGYAQKAFPSLPILVVSATSKADLDNVKRMYPKVQILQKPFKLAELFAAVAA